VRVNKVLKRVLGLGREVVIVGWELTGLDEVGVRACLQVEVGLRAGRRGRCGRCGRKAPGYDQGQGRRRWRHVDVGFATCELIAQMPRVECRVHGPTVIAVSWARHDTTFTAAFEDVVVHDAVVANKQAAADRYGISWRAVNNACVRLATEALGRTALLDGLVAVAIDEVKYKRGQRYLTVVGDHVTGKVVWAATGRSKDTFITMILLDRADLAPDLPWATAS
jgi:transposase